jgi:hypothetical protein
MWSQSNRHRIPVVPRIRKLAAEEANKFLGTPLATWALLLMLALLTILGAVSLATLWDETQSTSWSQHWKSISLPRGVVCRERPPEERFI